MKKVAVDDPVVGRRCFVAIVEADYHRELAAQINYREYLQKEVGPCSTAVV